jgi:small-conductance mechanosensitive channel
VFREHGLVIAFPQRDVHLDSVTPLEVRVVGADQDSSDSK